MRSLRLGFFNEKRDKVVQNIVIKNAVKEITRRICSIVNLFVLMMVVVMVFMYDYNFILFSTLIMVRRQLGAVLTRFSLHDSASPSILSRFTLIRRGGHSYSVIMRKRLRRTFVEIS